MQPSHPNRPPPGWVANHANVPHGPPYPAAPPQYNARRGDPNYPPPTSMGVQGYYAAPAPPYHPHVAYYPHQHPHPHGNYPAYPGPPPGSQGPYYGPVSPGNSNRPLTPAYLDRPTSPQQLAQYRSQSPDLVQVARPYRSIIGSLSSGDVPSGGQLQNLLNSAIEGLQLLDPQTAQHIGRDSDISNDGLRFRKTRPRVEYMERPPNQLTPPLQPDSGKSLDGDDSEEEDKPKQPQIKRRKREGAGANCSGCRSTTTPEWRRGPTGPRTLCNACGLVYGKLVHKKKAYDDAIVNGQYIAPATLFAEEANEGWGDRMPSTPDEMLALIRQVRNSVVGGGHPRKARENVSSPSSSGTGASIGRR